MTIKEKVSELREIYDCILSIDDEIGNKKQEFDEKQQKDLSDFEKKQADEKKDFERSLGPYMFEKQELEKGFEDRANGYFEIKLGDFIDEVCKLLEIDESVLQVSSCIIGTHNGNHSKEHFNYLTEGVNEEEICAKIFSKYNNIHFEFRFKKDINSNMADGKSIFDHTTVENYFLMYELEHYSVLRLDEDESYRELIVPIPYEALVRKGTVFLKGNCSVINTPFDVFYLAMMNCISKQEQQGQQMNLKPQSK